MSRMPDGLRGLGGGGGANARFVLPCTSASLALDWERRRHPQQRHSRDIPRAPASISDSLLPIFVKFEPRHPDARLIGRRVRITCMQFPVPTLRHCPVFCSSLAMLCSGLSHLSHLVCILNGSILSILCCDSPTKKASILSCCSRLRR